MSDRFFSSERIESDFVTLEGAEAHHLLHVMRAKTGDEITLFDDSGVEFTASVESLGRANVRCRVIERHMVDRELPYVLELGVALPKGDRQKWLVEKLTEVGVTALVPLATERGVAQPTGGAIERLQRTVIEASKQCGRNRLLRISEPQSWAKWLASEGSSHGAKALRLVAHPSGGVIRAIDAAAVDSVKIAIGPEGGFTDSEIAAARDAGWQGVSLGARILRVETAAVALAALFSVR